MTEAEATEVVMLMKAASSRNVEQDTLEYFIARLTTYDYEPALAAATVGAGVWRFFPSWADYSEMYRAQKRSLGEPVGEQRDQTPLKPAIGPVSKEVPLYVKRWIASRFLYYRFNREQDLRPFREHEDQVDQTDGPIEWMPDDEWLTESERVSDKEVWGILTTPKPGDWTF